MIKSGLLHNIGGFVDGHWTHAKSVGTFAVTNPATGEHLADVPAMDAEEAGAAVAAAARALGDEVPVDRRRQCLDSLVSLMAEHRAELARIITQEQGKPLKESLVEVDYAAGFFRYFAGRLDHLAPRTLEPLIRGCRWTVHHRPAGVVGLITPWNFPLAMLSKKLSAAIAAGCTVVAKPASLTPLSVIALWSLAEKAGFPAGWLNLVCGRAGPIARTLCEHPLVRVISFTGSTEVGRELSRMAADHIKRLAMELGGNAPFIVFEDTDPAAAADALIPNKFRCAGQTCVCTNRVFVHADLEAAFVEALADRVNALKVGDGMDPATDIGPLINREGFDKVAGHVADALAKGARRIVGHDPHRPEHDWGCFYPPTLLTGARPDMLVFQEETFGPVLAVSAFRSEDEVLSLANGTPYGLAAYVFTADAKRAERCARRLNFGHVGINTGTGPTPEAPFGGMKQSGFGREGSDEGLLEFCETQTLASA